MTTRTLLLFCFAVATQPAPADTKAPSVMFEPPPQTVTGTPPLETRSTGNECEALLQQIEDLKGKPQRRHAARERYQALCTQQQP